MQVQCALSVLLSVQRGLSGSGAEHAVHFLCCGSAGKSVPDVRYSVARAETGAVFSSFLKIGKRVLRWSASAPPVRRRLCVLGGFSLFFYGWVFSFVCVEIISAQ